MSIKNNVSYIKRSNIRKGQLNSLTRHEITIDEKSDYEETLRKIINAIGQYDVIKFDQNALFNSIAHHVIPNSSEYLTKHGKLNIKGWNLVLAEHRKIVQTLKQNGYIEI